MLRSLVNLLTWPLYRPMDGVSGATARSSLETLQQATGRRPSATGELQTPEQKGAAIDTAQRNIEDFIEKGADTAPTQVRSQILRDLETATGTINELQPRLVAGTATPQDMARLEAALKTLDGLLQKVETNNSAAPAQPPSTARDAYVNLSGKIGAKAFETAYGALANERGESGRIQFRIEVDAAVGGGAGRVGGWLQTGIEVNKDDTGRTCMTLDYEAALKAGIDLSWLKVEGFVGTSGKVTLRFDSNKEAAAFTVDLLQKVNATAQGKLFTMEPCAPSYTRPTVIVEIGAFAGAKVTIGKDEAPFKVEGELRASAATQQFITSDGKVVTGSSARVMGSADFQIKLGKGEDATEIGVKFEGYWERIENDPVAANNGIARGGSVEIDLAPLAKLSPEKLNAALQQIAAKMSVPAGEVNRFIQGVTESIAEAHTGNSGKTETETKMKLVINFHQEREPEEGEPHVYGTQYVRVSLKSEFEASTKVDAAAAKTEVEFTASKTEQVYEYVGRNTETYLKGLYENPGEWARFKRDNPGMTIRVYEGGKHSEPLTFTQMEARWAAQGQAAQQVDEQINADSHALVSRGSAWVVDYPSEQAIVQYMTKYAGQPDKLQKLVDYMEQQGLKLGALLDKVDNKDTHNQLVALVEKTGQYQQLQAAHSSVAKTY